MAFLLLAGMALGAAPAAAMIQCTTGACCVDDVNGVRGANCTSNDVTFVLVGLGQQTDGCVNPEDTVSIFLRAVVENTTAQERYDIGMYIATDGDPNGDGAVTGQCARERLTPASPTSFIDDGIAPQCLGSDGNLLDLLRAFTGPNASPDDNGYYLTAETGGSNSLIDACGDLADGGQGGCDTDGDGNWDESVMDFTQAVTVPCTDTDDDGINPNTSNDGFVNLPTCATWGNQANEVFTPTTGGAPNDTCDSEAEVVNGTPAKCRCEDTNSNIPVADLGLTCSCTPGSVRPNQSTTCTVTYNNALDCTPDTSTAERFRCGTASFIRFKTDYLNTIGSVFSTSAPQPTVSGNGSVDSAITPVPTTADPIVWRPRNQISGGSLGVVGDNQSGTLTFQYLVNTGTAAGTYNIATTDTFWSDTSTFTTEVQQAALSGVNCSITVDPGATYASVSSFTASEAEGQVVVEWQTAAEAGSLGFELWRQDPATAKFVKASRRLLPAVGQVAGGRYRFVDPKGLEAASVRRELVYRLVEIDTRGERHTSGPYRVSLRPARSLPAAEFTRAARSASERVVAAAAEEASPRAVIAAALAPGGRLRIEVEREGLYRLPVSQLATVLGLPPGAVDARLKTGGFQLSQGGEPVAWRVSEDGKALLFYGQALDSPFAVRNVYWLELGQGVAMESVAGTPAAAPGGQSFLESLHFETDAFHNPSVVSDPRAGFWFWRSFLAGDPFVGEALLSLDVPQVASGTPATLTLDLVGFDPVNRVRANLNGVLLGQVEWRGRGRHTASLPVRKKALRSGTNQLTLFAEEGIFFLDAVDVTYRRNYRAAGDRLRFRGDGHAAVTITGFKDSSVTLYDLTDPHRPQRVADVVAAAGADGSYALSFAPASAETEYLAASSRGSVSPPAMTVDTPSDLRSERNAAAYLVITDAKLAAGAEHLAELREAGGLSALVVDVQDIMDEFNDGIYDPEAIRRFLAFAAESWEESPRYVVLAGRGTYDYKNLLGLGSNHVPLYMVATADGLAPSDAAYGDLDADGVPDVPVGRIPALTALELERYAEKVAIHEASLDYPMASRATIVADDPDSAGDFHLSARALLGALPPEFAARTIELPIAATPAQIENIRSAVQGSLRAGVPLVTYIGHGGLDRLANEGLLVTSDVANLSADGLLPGRLSVLAALTCIVGLHAFPTVTSLGEELVMREAGGTAAVIAPTWLSGNTAATELGKLFAARLANTEPGRLGDRYREALAAFAAASGNPDMLRIYSLLGDPALEMAR